jgi:hypothetical protein
LTTKTGDQPQEQRVVPGAPTCDDQFVTLLEDFTNFLGYSRDMAGGVKFLGELLRRPRLKRTCPHGMPP